MTDKSPAEVFPPGDRLKEELDARGWTQADLAEILGRPPRLISELITAKRAITPETAHGLGQAFGTGPDFWMNLEIQYQLARTARANHPVARRAKIYGQFPVKDMQRRGWLKPATALDDIEEELKNYFQISSLDDDIEIAYAAKKTSYEKLSTLQAAWLTRAQQLAETVSVSSYAQSNLEHLYAELRNCVAELRDAAKVPELLSKAGIRLLLIAPLPGSKIDGACMWFRKQPLVALTLRYDKHDIFWHALFHELDHIENGEGKSQPVVDSDLLKDCSDGPLTEKRANQTAASRLIPPDDMRQFISRFNPYYSDAAILSFAAHQKVHPGIVVGQLQHRGLVPWSSFSRFKAKIRDIIVPKAVTDGFSKHADG
jgi:HTH-type transcriptional regulator / antitoxin HigA